MRLTYSLYLVDIKSVYDIVKHAIETVEHVDDLVMTKGGAEAMT